MKKKMNNIIPVAEIFGPTIQGEGPNTGLKSIFVRVMGCDFKCEWCDSKFAWKKSDTTRTFTESDLAVELLNRCIATNTRHIILTGGNPCLYDFENVIDILHHNHITVDIETQGSILPDWLKKLDLVVISPKAPSSGQLDVWSTVYIWLRKNKKVNVAIKIPVFTEDDIDFAKEYYQFIEGPDSFDNIKLYINVGNTNTHEAGDISERVLHDYKKLIDRICNSDMRKVYIMPQLHTLVWGNKQGV